MRNPEGSSSHCSRTPTAVVLSVPDLHSGPEMAEQEANGPATKLLDTTDAVAALVSASVHAPYEHQGTLQQAVYSIDCF